MLYSIGQAAVRRVVTGAPQLSTTRSILTIWHLQNGAISKQDLISIARKYATATKVTKTTRTTVKATPAKPKTRTPSTKTKSTNVTKTTKGRKKAVRKVAKKKPKKKTTAKAKAKAQTKKRTGKKVLTEKQRAAVALKKQRDRVKQLRATALVGEQPKNRGDTAWQVYLLDKVTGEKNAIGHVKEVSTQYKALSPEDIEQLNHRANENIAHNRLAYKRWVETHTPDQIRQANSARVSLRRKQKQANGKSTKGLRKIHDARIVSGRKSAYNTFTKDRWASGDLKGIAIIEAARLLSREWKALTPAERKVYDDLAAADNLRYQQEYETVYKHPVPSKSVRAKSRAKST